MARKKKRVSRVLVILSFCIMFVFFEFSSLYAAIFSSISGRVVSEDTGEGIEDVQVLARLIKGGHWGRYYATTDSRGNFVLKDLEPGTYILGFHKMNSLYLSEDPHVEVVLPKGKHVVNVNYVLMLGGSLSGTIYDADEVTPISGVGVYASVPDHQPEWIHGFGYEGTDSNGKFLLQGLPESESCIVEVMVLGHARLMKTVKITKGNVTGNVNFIVKWDDITGISGYVMSSIDNKPIIDVKVDLTDSSGNDIAFARTDATGKYSIVAVPPGVFKATAFCAQSNSWIEKTDIVIESGASTEVNFEFAVPALISKNIQNIWQRLIEFLAPDAFAQGGRQNRYPEPKIVGCSTTDRRIIKIVYEIVRNFIINFNHTKENPCFYIGDKGLQGKLKEKIRKALTIKCIDKGCVGVGGKSVLDGKVIELCPSFFEYYDDEEDRRNRCPESILLHELIHSVQKYKKNQTSKENNKRTEKEAYACAQACYPLCGKDDPHEREYKGGCCP